MRISGPPLASLGQSSLSDVPDAHAGAHQILARGDRLPGLQRVETYPVAEAALREAVINAIAHKDYGSGIPIQISVYYDKLMIWNPGVLPPGWTADFLTAKHASAPYNPDVANAFFSAALLESWGRGIDLIRDACHAHGSPPLAFRWDNGLWVELPFLAAQAEPGSRPESRLESRPMSRGMTAIASGSSPVALVLPLPQRRMKAMSCPRNRCLGC